jgi:hypothetical protein
LTLWKEKMLAVKRISLVVGREGACGRHAQRTKLELAFDLPRGCHATLIAKWITAAKR